MSKKPAYPVDPQDASAIGKIAAQGIPVVQFELTGTVVARFPSASMAAESVGCCATSIVAVCNRKQSSAGGYGWLQGGPDTTPSADDIAWLRCARNRRAVVQSTRAGEFVARFESGAEAARATKGNAANITQVCKETRARAGGFRWAYEAV